MTLKAYSQYVKCTVGADFQLSFRQRLQLLFCKKVSVVFFDKRTEKKKDGADK